jgi:hypothetical protein
MCELHRYWIACHHAIGYQLLAAGCCWLLLFGLQPTESHVQFLSGVQAAAHHHHPSNRCPLRRVLCTHLSLPQAEFDFDVDYNRFGILADQQPVTAELQYEFSLSLAPFSRAFVRVGFKTPLQLLLRVCTPGLSARAPTLHYYSLPHGSPGCTEL